MNRLKVFTSCYTAVYGINMAYLTEENGVANGYGPPDISELPSLDLSTGEITGPPPKTESQPEFVEAPQSEIDSEQPASQASVTGSEGGSM
jgi:hypothetical protein